MASESYVVLDVDRPQVKLLREKVATDSSRWRTWGVLLLVALCASAAVCFSINKIQSRPDETDNIRHSLRQISQTAKASIHLSGIYEREVSNTSVQWQVDQGQAFAEGLALVDNEIQIPHTGIYFVYSQASYRLSCMTNPGEDEGKVLHLSHTVWRWSDSYLGWKPLLNSIRSACRTTSDDDGSKWYSAIYLGAAFQLEAGDRLKTVMDSQLLPKVEDGEGKTFFGVFAL